MNIEKQVKFILFQILQTINIFPRRNPAKSSQNKRGVKTFQLLQHILCEFNSTVFTGRTFYTKSTVFKGLYKLPHKCRILSFSEQQ